MAFVFVAFLWGYLVGMHWKQNIKEIKIKKHGNKAKSIFKYGLDYIANCLINNKMKLISVIFSRVLSLA